MKNLITFCFLLLTSVLFAQKTDTITTESGLKYYFVQHGEGEKVKDGYVIIAHYDGLFLDGSKFDSSRDRNEAFSFIHNKGQVIKGMDEAVSLLRIGDRAVFIIPSDLAYGERGARGAIPPNSTLIFDLEILDMKEKSLYTDLAETLHVEGDTTLHFKEMIKRYNSLKKKDFENLYAAESDLNRLGYELMEKNPKYAVEVFKMNVKAYPASANVYDSLGEGYMHIDNNKKAIENYEKSLGLDADNENAVKMIAKMKAE